MMNYAPDEFKYWALMDHFFEFICLFICMFVCMFMEQVRTCSHGWNNVFHTWYLICSSYSNLRRPNTFLCLVASLNSEPGEVTCFRVDQQAMPFSSCQDAALRFSILKLENVLSDIDPMAYIPTQWSGKSWHVIWGSNW